MAKATQSCESSENGPKKLWFAESVMQCGGNLSNMYEITYLK